jgi:hypothetical protein
MKIKKFLILTVLNISCLVTFSMAQENKVSAGCKMFMDNKIISEITVENAVQWAELTPPTVMCENRLYRLETFQINYLTLKPFLNKDFGIGEGGIPIMARETIKTGKAGDTIILKEVVATDTSGTKINLPIISFKLQ